MSGQPGQWRAIDAAGLLRAPVPASHKYSRGVLGLRTGSSAYPGAAVIGAEAAWRTGIGSVRYVTPLGDASPAHGLPSPAAAVLARRPETVFCGDGGEDRARSNAWLIGSGTDAGSRGFTETEALRELLAGSAPVVVDAGALGLIAERPPTAPTIITPHRGEFAGLWQRLGASERQPAAPEAAAILARELGVTVLLKGSRTIAVAPNGFSLVTGPATPWLATAGTGDVLAGMLGALVATHAARGAAVFDDDPALLARLGATAALLHDAAARIAASDAAATGDGGPVTALDIASAVPSAIADLRG